MKTYMRLKTQDEWKRYLQNLLATNNTALYKAVLTIYDGQTAAEKSVQETTEHNGIGFTGVDGNFLSSIAEQIKSGKQLSDRQIAYVRMKMPKYWKQLMVISKRKIEEEKKYRVEIM